MEPRPIPERRSGKDRRSRPTRAWDAFRVQGRRARVRRREDHRHPYYVERFSRTKLVLIGGLMALTLGDGLFTLRLLEAGYPEANPVMRALLSRGVGAFLVGKYLLTLAGVPILLVFQNHSLFGTRFRVGYLIPTFVLLYGALLAYQAWLLRAVFS